jgi:hypothetical protein
MGIGHVVAGLAAKPAVKNVPLWVLLVASEAIDILWGIFFILGLDSLGFAPWSHSLFMAVIWSLAAALLAGLVYRSRQAGAVIGLVVFSHWVLDFISHPMTGGPANLPLFFDGSIRLGLGAWTTIGLGAATVVELGLVAAGVAIVVATHRRATQAAREG